LVYEVDWDVQFGHELAYHICDIGPWMRLGPWAAGWGGYDVGSCGQWLIDGGERLEKKNHGAM
jgi:hypothetical protein